MWRVLKKQKNYSHHEAMWEHNAETALDPDSLLIFKINKYLDRQL